MALKQIAFLTTNLSSALSTGTGINIPLASYTLLNSNLSASDTIYLVLERTHTTQREIILVSKTSNDNYNITSRGLFGTTEQSHESGVEVTCDDVPAYFEQLQDASAFPTGTSSVGIPLSKIKQEAWGTWVPTISANGSMTITGTTVTEAKYLQIGKIVYYKIVLTTGTIGGTPNNRIHFTVPVAKPSTAQESHAGTGLINNSGTLDGVVVSEANDTTKLSILTVPITNYTAGAWGYQGSGFYEAS